MTVLGGQLLELLAQALKDRIRQQHAPQQAVAD